MMTVEGGLYRTLCGAVVVRKAYWLEVLSVPDGAEHPEYGRVLRQQQWYAKGAVNRELNHPMRPVERIKP